MNKGEVARSRGGTEQDIESAWLNFGYIIVNDACEEWIRCAKRVRDLLLKKDRTGHLSQGEKMMLTRAIGEKRIAERWLRSDLCYSICGYTGAELLAGLRKQL